MSKTTASRQKARSDETKGLWQLNTTPEVWNSGRERSARTSDLPTRTGDFFVLLESEIYLVREACNKGQVIVASLIGSLPHSSPPPSSLRPRTPTRLSIFAGPCDQDYNV